MSHVIDDQRDTTRGVEDGELTMLDPAFGERLGGDVHELLARSVERDSGKLFGADLEDET